MKKIILIGLMLALGGCVTAHDVDLAQKEALCLDYGMVPQAYKGDIVCYDAENNSWTYFELIKESQFRDTGY